MNNNIDYNDLASGYAEENGSGHGCGMIHGYGVVNAYGHGKEDGSGYGYGRRGVNGYACRNGGHSEISYHGNGIVPGYGSRCASGHSTPSYIRIAGGKGWIDGNGIDNVV